MTTMVAPDTEAEQAGAAAAAEVARARVAVMVSTYQVDVVLPTKFPIEVFIDDLVAVLAEAVGQEVDFTPPSGQWSLARPGQQALPRWCVPADHDIVDGAVLMLAPVESGEMFTPVVEDVTEALALVNDRDFAEFDADTAILVGLGALVVGAAAVAGMLAWSWTRTSSGQLTWCALPALGLGLVAWVAAVLVRHRYASTRACLGLALAAMPLLLAGGAMLVPRPYGHAGGFGAANIEAGAVLTAVAAFTLLRLAQLGVATLTAIAVVAVVATAATLPLADTRLRPGQATAGAVLAGLLLLGLAPRISVLVARIRPPDLPDPGDEVSPVTLNHIFDNEADAVHEPDRTVEARARLAVTTLIGLVAASCTAIPVGAIAAAVCHPRGVPEIGLAVTVTVVLALRARAFPDRIQAVALLTAAAATWLGVGFVLVVDFPTPMARLVVVGVVVVGLVLGCAAAAALPGARLSPVTRRVIDVIEFGLILVVPVLCFVIMGVYTATRRI